MIEVTAVDLNNLLENITLYTNPKAIRLREAFFVANVNKLQGFACDDYIAITDLVDVVGDDSKEFALDSKTLDTLLEWVKKDKKVVHKQTIKITFFNTYLKVKDEEGNIEKFEYVEPNYEAWDVVLQLLDTVEFDPKLILDFAVRPDRFAKLARLKADKEAPLMFRGIDINGKLVLQFKRGLTLVGAAMPIDQTYIREEFLWNQETSAQDQSLVNTEASPSLVNTESAASFTD